MSEVSVLERIALKSWITLQNVAKNAINSETHEGILWGTDVLHHMNEIAKHESRHGEYDSYRGFIDGWLICEPSKSVKEKNE